SVGTPAFVGCIGDHPGCTATSPAGALKGAWGVAVSRDGKQLYTSADTAGDVSHFTLNSTGNPTFAGCIGDHPGCTATTPAGALDDAQGLALSPDGKQLYAAADEKNTVARPLSHITRDPSGAATFAGRLGAAAASPA